MLGHHLLTQVTQPHTHMPSVTSIIMALLPSHHQSSVIDSSRVNVLSHQAVIRDSN